MKKRLMLFLAIIAALSFVGVFAACGNDREPQASGRYTITVENSGNGRVSVKQRANEGEDITVKFTPDNGYEVEEVKVNSKIAAVTDNQVTFVMPERDVVITVKFEKCKYGINVAAVKGGTVSFGRETEFEKGDSVTLEVVPDYGYEVAGLKVDGNAVTLTDGKYTLTMPEKDVEAVPEFTCAADTEQLPSGSLLTFSATAPFTGGVAEADVFAEFGEEAVTFKAYVSDALPVVGKDGVRLYFGTTEFTEQKVSELNLAVETLVGGDKTVLKGNSAGAYVTNADITGVTVACKPWSVKGGEVCGYVMTVTVAYTELGLTADNARSSITVLPYLVNSDNRNINSPATVISVDDYYSYANPDTYMTVGSSGLLNNRYMFGKGAVGSYKSAVTKGQYWNTDKDYEFGSANYAEREFTLTGHDRRDNDIAFIGSAGRTSFVKATFAVTGLFDSNDQHPKFGLTVFDTAARGSGMFFYVSADMANADNNTLEDMTGTQLGFSTFRNGMWKNDWADIGNAGAFDLTTKTITLALTYNNGFVYMYNCKPEGDELVGATVYKTKGDIVFGIKCFALELKVTDYTATNDPDSAEFKEHNKRADGVTVGDNAAGFAYTDGWTFNGDVAENNGKGDQVVYIKNVKQSKSLYGQATVTSPRKTGNLSDQWTKVGAVLRNDDYLIFAYIDLADSTSAINRVATNFAVFYEANRTWAWEVSTSHVSVNALVESENVDIGIAKLDEDFYLVVNGLLVASYSNSALRDQAFVPGILGMNRFMQVTSGEGTANEAEIRDILGITLPDGINFDGVLDEQIWSAAVLGTKTSFNANVNDGNKMEFVAVKMNGGVLAAVTLYTKDEQSTVNPSVSWNAATNVSFRLGDINNSGSAQFIALYNGLSGGVVSSVGILGATAKKEAVTLDNGKTGFKTTIEFFIPYKYFIGCEPTDEKIPFHVWSFKIDNLSCGAMNSRYPKLAYVTSNGLLLEDKA